MDLLEVVRAGFFTTVQDLGRYGAQRYGVPVAGAMDLFAFRAANRLVGNPDASAGLEVTMGGLELRALAPAAVAVTGADVHAQLNDRPVPQWHGFALRPGDIVRLGSATGGMRSYVAIGGGIDVPLVLGSRSTYLKSGIGGIEGRPLRDGDRIPGTVGEGPRPRIGQLPRAFIPRYGARHVVRVVLGPQEDAFTPDGVRTFLSSVYRVSPKSDRVGCRLEGPKVEHTGGPDIVSDGSPFGAVQVAGDGLPIVLLADRGTAGGYTKIATVISADLMYLAQAAPGDEVLFRDVSVDEARAALLDLERLLDSIDVTDAAGVTAPSPRAVAAAAAALQAAIGDDSPPL